MDYSKFITLFAPLYVLFFIIFPEEEKNRNLKKLSIKRRIKKIIKKGKNMNNEILKKYIGKSVTISFGSYGTNITGKINDIKENWLELESKKGVEIINVEFIQNIKIKYN